MTPADATELFELSPHRDRDADTRRRFDACVGRIAVSLQPRVTGILRPHERVLQRQRVTIDDGVQEVLRKLFESPPQNPHGAPPDRALKRWVRVVASNWVRDLARRRIEVALESSDGDEPEAHAPAPVDDRTAEDAVASHHDARRAWTHATHCRQVALNETQRICWAVITKEPDISGNELACRLAICDCDAGERPTPAHRNSADQHKVRTLRRMRACLERCGVDLAWAKRGAASSQSRRA